MHALTFGVALLALSLVTQTEPLTIPGVRSGSAKLVQRGRLTILEVASKSIPLQRIPLTHPSDYLQGLNAPYEVKLIAESPHHFLIFTDTFGSNPGNPQGRCGASDTGERFVHVVALGPYPHETLSLLIDSCLLDIEPVDRAPEWLFKKDSAGFVGKLTIRFARELYRPTVVYYASDDGSVTRPEIETDP